MSQENILIYTKRLRAPRDWREGQRRDGIERKCGAFCIHTAQETGGEGQRRDGEMVLRGSVEPSVCTLHKRLEGRPKKRWRDGIERKCGAFCMHTAQETGGKAKEEMVRWYWEEVWCLLYAHCTRDWREGQRKNGIERKCGAFCMHTAQETGGEAKEEMVRWYWEEVWSLLYAHCTRDWREGQRRDVGTVLRGSVVPSVCTLHKRLEGRPKKRWRDGIERKCGAFCMHTAQETGGKAKEEMARWYWEEVWCLLYAHCTRDWREGQRRDGEMVLRGSVVPSVYTLHKRLEGRPKKRWYWEEVWCLLYAHCTIDWREGQRRDSIERKCGAFCMHTAQETGGKAKEKMVLRGSVVPSVCTLHKRLEGRPKKRWWDGIERKCGAFCMHTAQETGGKAKEEMVRWYWEEVWCLLYAHCTRDWREGQRRDGIERKCGAFWMHTAQVFGECSGIICNRCVSLDIAYLSLALSCMAMQRNGRKTLRNHQKL